MIFADSRDVSGGLAHTPPAGMVESTDAEAEAEAGYRRGRPGMPVYRPAAGLRPLCRAGADKARRASATQPRGMTEKEDASERKSGVGDCPERTVPNIPGEVSNE
jgi:hypothetical protein